MLSNLHTHTVFCDGENTPEEIVLAAIKKGFDSIGFSGHGFTDFDLRYCMTDTEGYIKEISALKEKYKGEIQVYCGLEEDAFFPAKRDDFDYIIGSSHYFYVDGKYYPIDSNPDCFKECLVAFGYDTIKLTENYYQAFCDYIKERKPDIVGHFDLITKFDELDGEQRFLNNEKYIEIAKKYVAEAAKNDVIFEFNTGAISRGYRSFPYPCQELLYVLKNQGSKMMITSDSHSTETLNFYFEEAKKILLDTGFESVYVLHDGEFKKQPIK